MRIGILGTGMVGRALAEGFVRTGHEVSMGTRNVHETMVRPLDGTPASFDEWLAANPSV
jgi:8-hydroxy-5-deazaflavin:NADPH oxidoreductase